MTPLRFANPSPASGWIEDFHLQAVVQAWHTRKAPPKAGPSAQDAGDRMPGAAAVEDGVWPLL
jgi:hypothetical protein